MREIDFRRVPAFFRKNTTVTGDFHASPFRAETMSQKPIFRLEGRHTPRDRAERDKLAPLLTQKFHVQ